MTTMELKSLKMDLVEELLSVIIHYSSKRKPRRV